MTKKVSEPQVDYQRSKHSVVHSHATVNKIKISSLRGKLKKQDEAEIDNQIFTLRQEWERDF
jgi:hypothetical protein